MDPEYSMRDRGRSALISHTVLLLDAHSVVFHISITIRAFQLNTSDIGADTDSSGAVLLVLQLHEGNHSGERTS